MPYCDPAVSPGGYDDDVERLSHDLKKQVERAKERISDRYGKLIDVDRQESEHHARLDRSV